MAHTGCKRPLLRAIAGAACLGLAACAGQSLSTMSQDDKMAMGTVTGAVIGGAIGYSLVGGA